MTAPTGPMDPKRLARLRHAVATNDAPTISALEDLRELLSAHDHWHDVAGGRLRAGAELDDEVTRLQDRVAALSQSRDSRLDPLRKALLTLARAVIDGDGLSAKTLAADVLDDHERGEL